MGHPQTSSCFGTKSASKLGKRMRLLMLPKTPGKGTPVPPREPSRMLSQHLTCVGPEAQGPRGLFLSGCPSSKDFCSSVALGSTFVCLRGISHTFAQALTVLVLLGTALFSGCPHVRSPGGLTPGPSLGSAQWPPESPKSNQNFSGPWTAVFATDLLLGEAAQGEAGLP